MRAVGLAVLLLAGCGRSEPEKAQPAPHGAQPPAPKPRDTSVTDSWVGKWVGVEGLAIDIEPRGAAGRYRLTVHLLDGVEQFAGEADGDVIRFDRNGKPAVLRHVTGAETGLKWLAEKKDCLMIEPGEGFCRD